MNSIILGSVSEVDPFQEPFISKEASENRFFSLKWTKIEALMVLQLSIWVNVFPCQNELQLEPFLEALNLYLSEELFHSML